MLISRFPFIPTSPFSSPGFEFPSGLEGLLKSQDEWEGADESGLHVVDLGDAGTVKRDWE